MRHLRQFTAGALTSAIVLCAVPAQAQGPGFQVTSDGPALELRFRGVPLKSVRADDNQNALSLDFNQPVDPAIFDALARQLPQWITMAYTSYDNGVIRATRPVTFLTRQETDGFSLRLQPRAAAAPAPMVPAPGVPQQLPGPMAQGPVMAPYPQQAAPPAQAYPQGYPQQPVYPPQGAPGYPPQPGMPPAQTQPPFAPYETYGAARNYYGLRYAERRAAPVWRQAYDRSAMQGSSEGGFGVEVKTFKNNDRILASRAHVKVTLADGIALLGSIEDVDSQAAIVRTATGTFAADKRNVLTGAAGIAFELGGDSELTLQGLVGNGTTGARLTGYSGTPDGFFSTSLAYHQPLLNTAEAVLNKGRKDEIEIATAARLGWGLWGSLEGRYTNYGTATLKDAVQTAGWDGNLRWDYDLGGIALGLGYDGHGEYRIKYTTATGTVPSPYVPLSIRNMETHATTMALSSAGLWDGVWFDLYGGYVYDRYAKTGGGLYGISVRYTPVPGLDLELGARRSNVSMTQGMTGGETSAGLSMTLGFGGSPRNSRFALW
jgi:hypothetical protein